MRVINLAQQGLEVMHLLRAQHCYRAPCSPGNLSSLSSIIYLQHAAYKCATDVGARLVNAKCVLIYHAVGLAHGANHHYDAQALFDSLTPAQHDYAPTSGLDEQQGERESTRASSASCPARPMDVGLRVNRRIIVYLRHPSCLILVSLQHSCCMRKKQ